MTDSVRLVTRTAANTYAEGGRVYPAGYPGSQNMAFMVAPTASPSGAVQIWENSTGANWVQLMVLNPAAISASNALYVAWDTVTGATATLRTLLASAVASHGTPDGALLGTNVTGMNSAGGPSGAYTIDMVSEDGARIKSVTAQAIGRAVKYALKVVA